MEIVSNSSAQQPERLLHDDTYDENRSETLSALVSAICDMIFTTSFLPKKSLISSLEALEIQESRFRLALTNIRFNWNFTLKEQYIIQDAADGLYVEGDIEGAFYQHGGHNGIIALILFFRRSANIQRDWAAMIEKCRAWLVKHVVKMLSKEIVEWIPYFLSTRVWHTAPHPLQYLGGHAGRKRKKYTLETENNSGATQAPSPPSPSNSRDTSATVLQQSQQPQDIYQIGRVSASRPQNHQHFQFSLNPDGAGTPYQQGQQSFQSPPPPISNTSSLEQDLRFEYGATTRSAPTDQQSSKSFAPIPISDSNLPRTSVCKDPLRCATPQYHASTSPELEYPKIVPKEQRLTEEECSSWSRDPSLFWTSSSCTFLPPETCHKPLRFVYDATSQIEPQSREDCLRRRYLALFWFDYCNARYPEQQAVFDNEYVELAQYALGVAAVDSDAIASALRDQVKTGRIYNMLTRKFGDGILLTLPSSICRSMLEKKLPLDQKTFNTWIAPVVPSIWEEQARTDGIRDLGQRIRRIILQRCLPRHTNSLAPAARETKNEGQINKYLVQAPNRPNLQVFHLLR